MTTPSTHSWRHGFDRSLHRRRPVAQPRRLPGRGGRGGRDAEALARRRSRAAAPASRPRRPGRACARCAMRWPGAASSRRGRRGRRASRPRRGRRTSWSPAIVGTAGVAAHPCGASGRAARWRSPTRNAWSAPGYAFMRDARQAGTRLLPMDSASTTPSSRRWAGIAPTTIEPMILTASGGPIPDLAGRADRRRAAARRRWPIPTGRWAPRSRSTRRLLMNKGLELIEAHHLFGVAPERSRSWSIPSRSCTGWSPLATAPSWPGSPCPTCACLSLTASAIPDRLGTSARRLDLAAIARLDFEAPDLVAFPGTETWPSTRCGAGGTLPTVLNAANEIAVEAFLAGRLRFPEFPAWSSAHGSDFAAQFGDALRQTVEDALASRPSGVGACGAATYPCSSQPPEIGALIVY